MRRQNGPATDPELLEALVEVFREDERTTASVSICWPPWAAAEEERAREERRRRIPTYRRRVEERGYIWEPRARVPSP